MKTLIIYGSQYGSTKRYAERLAEMTGIEAVDYKDAKNINDYERIIYFGALYAGGVTGLKKTVSKIIPNHELVIITVGLANPTDSENVKSIRNSIKSQIPSEFYDESKIFHLRGAIDYTQLGLKHKVMMSLLHSKVSKMPESELNAEAKAMLETYGQKVDFVDYTALEQITSKL